MNEKPLELLHDLFTSLAGYLPALFAGLSVLLVGAAVAWLGAKILTRVLILMRVDRVLIRLGLGRALEKGDVRHSLFELAGLAFGGLVFLVFLDNAVTIWKLTVLSQLLERLVLFAPQLLTALFILLIGAGIAAGVSVAVKRSLLQEGFARAHLAARIVRATILAQTSAIALVQLNIAVGIVTGSFLLAFGALALGFALAFGLGSRRAVERMWEEHFRPQQPVRDKGKEGADPR